MIAQAATGCVADSYEKRCKLLNGMKGPGKKKRMDDSGIKHSKYNKFHLMMQAEYLDFTPPALIIVPILSLEKILAWDGETSYRAMVLPCGDRGTYAAQNVMRHVRDCCDETEIGIGIEVLCDFIKAVAGSLIDPNQDILADVQRGAGFLPAAALVVWIDRVNALRGAGASIKIPKLKGDLDWKEVHVARGWFDRATSCLPDPFLLAVKGAVNVSSHNMAKLMPACQRRLDESDSGSEEDTKDDPIDSNSCASFQPAFESREDDRVPKDVDIGPLSPDWDDMSDCSMEIGCALPKCSSSKASDY
jgi:hypothetical protein